MKLATTIPDTKQVLFTANATTVISSFFVNCGSISGASFQLFYNPKSSGAGYFLFPKVFTPAPYSVVTFPGLPFTMQSGDSISGSASDGTNYTLFLD